MNAKEIRDLGLVPVPSIAPKDVRNAAIMVSNWMRENKISLVGDVVSRDYCERLHERTVDFRLPHDAWIAAVEINGEEVE